MAFSGSGPRSTAPPPIIALPEAMPLLRFYYSQISGEHPDWDEYERDMVAQGRVVIAVQPESAGPDLAG